MTAYDIWNDLFGGFESMNRRIEDLFSSMDMNGPDVKTYGYTMWQGPDGVKHVKEFGNSGSRMNAIGPSGKEPFTDVSEEKNVVRVVAEIPGVQKQRPERRAFHAADLPSTIVCTAGRGLWLESFGFPMMPSADKGKRIWQVCSLSV